MDNSLQLPDIYFQQKCEQEFGLNKGIYNTIDIYFFKAGIQPIESRRRVIVEFLTYCVENNWVDLKKERLKFGAGNLTLCLKNFLHKYDLKKEKIY